MDKNALEKTERKLILAASDEVIDQLDFYSEQGGLCSGVKSNFRRIFMTSSIVYHLNQLLTPKMMESVMWLQNNPLGFLTDQKGAGYSMDIVRMCLIDAAFEGVSPVGNEFNILAGRCYITKNGMRKKLSQIPGLRYHVTPGIPKLVGEKGAVAAVHLDWTYAGEHQEQDLEFAIRVNAGMGADAIIGKATRKAYAWLYEEVTGNQVSDGDVMDADPLITDKTLSPIEEAKPAIETKAAVQQELEM